MQVHSHRHITLPVSMQPHSHDHATHHVSVPAQLHCHATLHVSIPAHSHYHATLQFIVLAQSHQHGNFLIKVSNNLHHAAFLVSLPLHTHPFATPHVSMPPYSSHCTVVKIATLSVSIHFPVHQRESLYVSQRQPFSQHFILPRNGPVPHTTAAHLQQYTKVPKPSPYPFSIKLVKAHYPATSSGNTPVCAATRHLPESRHALPTRPPPAHQPLRAVPSRHAAVVPGISIGLSHLAFAVRCWLRYDTQCVRCTWKQVYYSMSVN